MNQTNLAIYDEFNCIEKICRDMFHAEKGVTTYIETMKMTSSFDAMCVPYWDDTLQMLKRTRDLRNKMAHEPGAFDEVVGCADDVEWLQDFHEQLLQRTDPLAIVEKNRQRARNMLTVKHKSNQNMQVNINRTQMTPKEDAEPEMSFGKIAGMACLAMAIIAVLIMVVLVAILLMYYR